MVRYCLPILYIEWKSADGENISIGPFWTIAPDGNGSSIGQNWMAYQVQTPYGQFERVYVPHEYHSIVARNDIGYDDGTKVGYNPSFPLKRL